MTVSTSKHHHEERDDISKLLPFKKRCHYPKNAMDFETAKSLRVQAMANYRRRYFEVQQQQQQLQQQHVRDCNHPYKQPSSEFNFFTVMQDYPELFPSTVPTVERKRVHFAETATVRTRSVTDEDLDNSWYCKQNYKAFESENRYTVSVYCHEGIDALDPEQFTVSGLEQYLEGRQYLVERRLRTMQHAVLVLELYDVQKCNRMFDPEMLRSVSRRFSGEPIRLAQTRAAVQVQ